MPCLSFDALKLGRSFAFKLAQKTAVYDLQSINQSIKDIREFDLIMITSKATQQPTAKTGLNG